MENNLLIGLSRQIALGRELEVVANNVANLNTTGYKADGTVFEEFLMPVARANQFSAADSRLSYVQDRATWHDFSQGPVQMTGNPLDVAIDGNAFLVVQTPRGERYTRNGALQINASGQLVTNDGFQVLGESGAIVFQAGDHDINIAADGAITVREGSNAKTDSSRGKLRLVSFADVGRLQKDGSSTFVAPQGTQPVAPQNTRLVQSAIEKSNVRSVIEMARMIEVTRSYTQISTLLQQQGDLNRTAIEKLAEVPV
jgi:flagellar basal-body rod protein FlgF/flagellar basal-body rod protein FlgG